MIESSIYTNMSEELNYLLFKNGIVDDFIISKVLKEIKIFYIWFIDDKEGSYDISYEHKSQILKNLFLEQKLIKIKFYFQMEIIL